MTLRERKKRRTHRVLVRTALDLFEAHGFPGTTLDTLCDTAEVSKRTFFRYFDGKEAVVLAPGHEMWTAVLDDLTGRDPAGRLLDVVGGAVMDCVGALDREDPEWAARLLRAQRLAAAHPSIETHGLAFCERTTRAMTEVLHRRGGLPGDDVRPRLCLDVAVRGVNTALHGWAARPGDPGADELVASVRRVLGALPGALALELGAAEGSATAG